MANAPLDAVCAIVGDQAADPVSLAVSLCQRSGADGKSLVFKGGTITTELPVGTVNVTYELCDNPDALVDLNPNVVVLCYTPLDPPTLDELLDVWARALDRMYPRPAAIVVGTRVDLLANRRILQKLHEKQIKPISVEDACDTISRMRISTYAEVSAASYTGIASLEASVARAAKGEAEKKVTPEIVSTMRAACIAAGNKKSATWTAKRDNSGRLFYVNRMNKKAQWDRPVDYDGEEPDLTQEEKRAKELAALEAEEKRAAQEREKEVFAAYTKDLVDMEDRIGQLERREDSLKLSCVTLSLELESVRKRIEANLTEREVLERERDSFLGNQKDFTKFTVEEDLRIEQEIQAAKNRAFELEAMNALREEKDFDLEIAEAVLRSRALATSLREVLQDQLLVQKNGAATQSRTALLNKKVEDNTKHVCQLRSRNSDLKKEQLEVKKQIEQLSQQYATLEKDLRGVKAEASDIQYSAVERHAKERKLIEMIEELDARITQLRPSSRPTPFKGVLSVDLELERLRAEQTSLIQQLAHLRASNALMEVRCEKQLLVYQHAEGERERAFEKLKLELTQALETKEVARNSFFQGEGYSPLPRAVIRNQVIQLEHSIQELQKAAKSTAVRRTLREQTAMLTELQAKLSVLQNSGESMNSGVKESALTIRNLKKNHNEAVQCHQSVLEGVHETLDELRQSTEGLFPSPVFADQRKKGTEDASDSETVTTHTAPDSPNQHRTGKISHLERFTADMNQALYGDPRAVVQAIDLFSQAVAKRSGVIIPERNTPAPSAPVFTPSFGLITPGSGIIPAAGSSSVKGAGNTEEKAKSLTRNLAVEFSAATPRGQPVTVPKALRPVSPRAGRKEWVR
jgi:hypothetical protein